MNLTLPNPAIVARRSIVKAMMSLLLLAPASADAEMSAWPSAAGRLAQTEVPGRNVILPLNLKDRDRELEALRAEQQKAAEAQAKLRSEIAEAGTDRRKINEKLIDTAQRVRAVEARIAATESRLKPLDDNERSIRNSLDGRRAVIAEVLAALQRLGRRPPPALMVRPEDALQSVRTAMLLGAVLPEMRSEAQALADELAELVRLRGAIASERDQLARDFASLSGERERLNLLIEARQKTQSAAERALAAERERAAALAQKAADLKDLIGKLEVGLDSATRAARAAARAMDDAKLSATTPALAALRDPGRLAPAVEFASTRGHIPLPVNGVKIRDFGAPDTTGGVQKGLSISTRAGAQVTAPCDGWVVYAGPFRSYGQLLILNAGGGYHILLAGMERISVDLGQFVLTGEPVAVMGGASRLAAAISTSSTQSVLYVEFRKDGTPIDPSPWWAHTGSEKVRG